MQSSTTSAAQPEAILQWLQREMGYRPLGHYTSSKASTPSADSIRKICRGNMIPVWNFLVKRLKSEKTVENIRRNILVHGGDEGGDGAEAVKETGRGKGRGRREKAGAAGGSESSGESSREIALQERDLAEKEV